MGHAPHDDPGERRPPVRQARPRWTMVPGHAALGLVAAALLALILALAPARAQSFPPFTGLVVDAANILPPDRKAALEAKLEALQQQTKRQLVVATIPDLQGYAIEDYGYRLGRAWGVGLKDADNGAILIVAPNDHKVRIEVGYGLEPVLTDALSSVIIQTRIVPAFKAGDIPGGIDAGADAIAEQLRLPDDQARAKVAAAQAAFDKAHRRSMRGEGHVPFGLIFWLVIIGVVILSSIGRRLGGQRYQGGGGSNWPIWLWAASELIDHDRRDGGGWGGGGGDGGGSDGGWGGGGFTGGGGGSFGGGGASGGW